LQRPGASRERNAAPRPVKRASSGAAVIATPKAGRPGECPRRAAPQILARGIEVRMAETIFGSVHESPDQRSQTRQSQWDELWTQRRRDVIRRGKFPPVLPSPECATRGSISREFSPTLGVCPLHQLGMSDARSAPLWRGMGIREIGRSAAAASSGTKIGGLANKLMPGPMISWSPIGSM
jgi:hypothetical protein